MPQNRTVRKAKAALRRGQRPTTAAGEFVREEIEHVREGKHGARSTRQAIAIGLSRARRAGVPLKPPRKGATSARTRKAAQRDYETGQGRRQPRGPSAQRKRATRSALQRESRRAASRHALSQHARRTARRHRARAGGR